jgi:RND family efflux transporter MFP subunit
MADGNDRKSLTAKEKTALAFVSILILAVSGAAVFYMMTNKPKPERRRPEPIAPLVDVRQLVPSSQRITVPVMGTVVPATEVDLKARVSGEVVWTHPEFVAGGIVKKGEVLVKINPVDYELALTAKKAVLEAAIYDLKAEQGQQEIARTEWELLGLGDDASALDRELALRQPQLAAMEAKLEAGKAEVRQSELDLERTVIRAPFNAIIKSTSIDVGGQANLQATLAHLVDSDTFYVQALVPLDMLKWIILPEGPISRASAAEVKSITGRNHTGRVFKLMSDLEPNGRLARLLIEVDDPLDLKHPNGTRKPMLLGDYVSAEIQGRTVEDVFLIEPENLRDGNSIYTVDSDDRIHIVEVDVVWRVADGALVRGIDPTHRLVVSNISVPVEGMQVRIHEAEVGGQESGVRSQ